MILSVPFVSIPFCPYHFVQYHFAVACRGSLMPGVISFFLKCTYLAKISDYLFLLICKKFLMAFWMPGAWAPFAPTSARHCHFVHIPFCPYHFVHTVLFATIHRL